MGSQAASVRVALGEVEERPPLLAGRGERRAGGGSREECGTTLPRAQGFRVCRTLLGCQRRQGVQGEWRTTTLPQSAQDRPPRRSGVPGQRPGRTGEESIGQRPVRSAP